MKTRANLKYFLKKRSTSLGKICRENNCKNIGDLIALLDDAGVESPSSEEIAFANLSFHRPKVKKSKPGIKSRIPVQQKDPETKEAANPRKNSEKESGRKRRRSGRTRNSNTEK